VIHQLAQGCHLSVGVVVAASVVPAWITLLLDDLLARGGTHVSWLRLAAPDNGVALPLRHDLRVWRCLDEAVFRRHLDLLAPVSVTGWGAVTGVSVCDHRGNALLRSEAGHAPAPTADLVLDLTGGAGGGVPSAGARMVTWWLEGVPVRTGAAFTEPPVVSSIISGAPVVEFTIHGRSPGREGVVLETVICPTHPSSPSMTAASLASSARQVLGEKLAHATAASVEAGVTRDAGRSPCTVSPNNWSGGTRVAGRTASGTSRGGGGIASARLAELAERRIRKAMSREQWSILIGELELGQMLPDPSRLRRIQPPPDRYWADPFVVEHQGRVHVLFEEYLFEKKRGRIAAVTLGDDRRPRPSEVALELESHLSYPCLFEYDGKYYMLPENADRAGLDLYESVSLPTRWEWRRRVIEDENVLDASIVQWDGLWWLFASLRKPAGPRSADLLVLYFSEDPVHGSWRRHAMSPILADVTNARPAGAPFVFEGRLHRLAQDGTHGYGWGIAVNEIQSLSPDSFAERRVAHVAPDWAPDLLGVHTLNRSGVTVVMDERRYIPRLSGPSASGRRRP
jgi:hypothetical protein